MARPPHDDRPLLADLRDEIARAGADLGEMARARWQLARLELEEAAGQVKRLAVVLSVAGVMALTALPVLVVWLSETLALAGGLSARGWMLLFGLLLLAAAGAGGWLAWRRFRREFAAFEQTLEEFREDLVWLREWAGREDAGQGGG